METVGNTHNTAGSATGDSTDADTQADDNDDRTAEDQSLFGLGENNSLKGGRAEMRMKLSQHQCNYFSG